MTTYDHLTITDGDMFFDMLEDDVVFRECDFDDADFRNIEADSLTIDGCTLRRADLTNLVCPALRITNSNAESAVMRRIEAHDAEITGCSLTSAKLGNAQLNLARIIDSDLSGADMDGANLFGADLSGSRLRGVDLSGARLDGVKIERTDFSLASLRGHSFRGQRLESINFTEADLSGCDFTDVVFVDCHLAGAFVDDRTRFDGADLRGAMISGAHLVRASLRGAVMLPSQVNTMVFDGFGIVVADGP